MNVTPASNRVAVCTVPLSLRTLAAWTLCAALLAMAGSVRAQEAVGDAAPMTPSATQVATAPAASEPATQPSTQVAAQATQPTATMPTIIRPSARTTSRPTSRSVSNSPISLNFKDATVRTVLEYLSEAAGLVIIEEVHVEGRVNVISMHDVNIDEAVALLDTVLKTKGCAAIRNGRTLRIVTLEQAKRELIPVRSGNDPAKVVASDRIVTHIIPVRSADAVRLKADLANLIPTTTDVTANAATNTLIVTGTESTIRRIMEIVQAIDGQMAGSASVKVFQLKYANAANAARLINDIFRDDTSGRTSSGGSSSGRSFNLPGILGGMSFGGGRSSSGGGSGGGLAGALGGASSGGGGPRAARVTASSDDRTNTLVVSAAPEMMPVIEGVIKELDSNPAETQAVFIQRLKNGDAKNLESILNNIFGWTGSSGTSGSRTSSSTFGTSGYGSSGRSSFGGTSNFASAGRGSGSAFSSSGRSSFGSSNGYGSSGSFGSSGRGSSGYGSTGYSSGSRSSAAGAAASDLAGQVYVVADTATNSLLVTTAPGNIARVQAIIRDLDRAVPQVLIKVLIAEVTHTGALDLGVEFDAINLRGDDVTRGLIVGNQVPFVNGAPPQAVEGKGTSAGTNFNVAAQTNGFMFRLDEKYVSAAIHAIATQGKLDVLSRPYILTSDNQAAQIFVGENVPYPTYTITSDAGQTTTTIARQDLGIKLQVTPHINPQGLVTLDNYAEISAVGTETVAISDTVSAPTWLMRYAQNRVAIRDGQTIVIGGLMEDRSTKVTTKVPFVGDIPLLGLLFQRTTDVKSKTELLIFLTPHVAQQAEDLKEMSMSEQAGTKIVQNAVEKGTFQDHLKGMERGASTRPILPEIEMIYNGDPTSTQPSQDNGQ